MITNRSGSESDSNSIMQYYEVDKLGFSEVQTSTVKMFDKTVWKEGLIVGFVRKIESTHVIIATVKSVLIDIDNTISAVRYLKSFSHLIK